MPDSYPRVLHVDTTFSPDPNKPSDIWMQVIDYRVYADVPAWWRRIEEWLRLDLYLAWRAVQIKDDFDVILAGSEKAGIPLAYMLNGKPLVTTVYHIASPWKARAIRFFKIHKRWRRIGYLSEADKQFVESFFRVPTQRMFRFLEAPLNDFSPGEEPTQDYILSAGVSKRDYPTLISAMADLPQCTAKIFATSQYPDQLALNLNGQLPPWIQFENFVPHKKMVEYYHRARFVVICLNPNTQYSAGFSVVLEAQASGKAVIATHTEGMVDLIKHGVTGLLVPPNDPTALRKAILELWENPNLAENMGQAGRRFVEESYHPSRHVATARQMICEVYSHSEKVGYSEESHPNIPA